MYKNEAASKNGDWDYFWVEGNHEHKFAAPKKYESEIPYEFIRNGWVRQNLQNFGILRLKTPRPPNWVNHVGGLDRNILKRINDLSGQHGNFVREIEVAELWRRKQLMRILLEMAQKVPPNQRELFFKFIDRTYRTHWTGANMKDFEKLLKTIISMKKYEQRPRYN